MQKQFVTYEIAKKLKGLGFDDEVMAYYDSDNGDFFLYAAPLGKFYYLKTPLWQQAIDWLYKEHKIIIEYRPTMTKELLISEIEEALKHIK